VETISLKVLKREISKTWYIFHMRAAKVALRKQKQQNHSVCEPLTKIREHFGVIRQFE
jgi:hypothetical protein